jgi:hypothetical protein
MRIFVFTYNRLAGLKRLWQSLVAADYAGGSQLIEMNVMLDLKASDRDGTLQWLKQQHWPHGPFNLHRREVNVGLKKGIIEAWYPTSDDEFAAFFEDDIEVSIFWYQWAIRGILRYYYQAAIGDSPHSLVVGDAKLNSAEADPKLLGLSLYRPIHDELSGHGCEVKNGNLPFALQQPCSWGAVYFPRPWRYFRDWYDSTKSVEPRVETQDGREPTSNTWASKSSWKKYLIKLMYDQGMFMIYPNPPDRKVLSTNHLMKGEHPTPPRKLFELPLVDRVFETLYSFPDLKELSVYDVLFDPIGHVQDLRGHSNRYPTIE